MSHFTIENIVRNIWRDDEKFLTSLYDFIDMLEITNDKKNNIKKDIQELYIFQTSVTEEDVICIFDNCNIKQLTPYVIQCKNKL
jgi:hypothetical protein